MNKDNLKILKKFGKWVREFQTRVNKRLTEAWGKCVNSNISQVESNFRCVTKIGNL